MTPLNELPYYEFTEDSGQVRRRYADAWRSKSIGLPAALAQSPIESGGKLTDHYRPDAETLRGELVFSNTPIRADLRGGERLSLPLDLPDPPKRSLFTPGGLNAAAQGAIGGLFGGTPGKPSEITTLQFPQRFDVRTEIFDEIQLIRTKGYLLTIYTGFALFENMGIDLATIDEDADTGDELILTLSTTRLVFATSDITFAIPIPTVPRAQKKKDAGAAGGATVPEVKQKTVAAAAVDALRGSL